MRRGDNVILTCNYDMDGDDVLYSVKWYKGKREFYRYTPKENPSMKTFAAAGITVEVTFLELFMTIIILNINLIINEYQIK